MNHRDLSIARPQRVLQTLGRKDDVPLPGLVPLAHRAGGLTVTGTNFEIGVMRNGQQASSNRRYLGKNLPSQLDGKPYSRLAGGVKAAIEVSAESATTLSLATTPSLPGGPGCRFSPDRSPKGKCSDFRKATGLDPS